VRLRISEDVVAQLRDVRRKGKNRQAARKSRQKRMKTLDELREEAVLVEAEEARKKREIDTLQRQIASRRESIPGGINSQQPPCHPETQMELQQKDEAWKRKLAFMDELKRRKAEAGARRQATGQETVEERTWGRRAEEEKEDQEEHQGQEDCEEIRNGRIGAAAAAAEYPSVRLPGGDDGFGNQLPSSTGASMAPSGGVRRGAVMRRPSDRWPRNGEAGDRRSPPPPR
jgi:hypothetical protein